ncbi:MAG: NADH-quinone oxidoreductase subunit J [Saprospiraceae bacterium]|nr:NADH-quinone oxidoreductase subunit J [Saprospiraceae bacterium]
MITQYLFYFLSALAITGAIFVVFTRNPVYSALALIVTFFSIAGHYFLLNSTFLAAVHIIVYSGAIMVLFLYVIMMMNLNLDEEPVKTNFAKFGAVISGCLLMLVLIVALRDAEKMSIQNNISEGLGTVNYLGQVLYKNYLLPFEVSAILFLSGMVGAVLLGKREIQ